MQADLRIEKKLEVGQPILLRRREVAQLLGISERTVQEMTSRGDLPYAKLAGRTIRYPREAINAFVETRIVRVTKGASKIS